MRAAATEADSIMKQEIRMAVKPAASLQELSSEERSTAWAKARGRAHQRCLHLGVAGLPIFHLLPYFRYGSKIPGDCTHGCGSMASSPVLG